MLEEVETVISEIRVFVAADGGDIELSEIDGSVVKIKLTGACEGCMSAGETVDTIRQIIMMKVPDVTEVIAT